MTSHGFKSVFAAALFSCIPVASAHAYPRAHFTNRTPYVVSLEVNYPGCSNDKLKVPAGKPASDGSIVPDTATVPAYRGGCLISWIKASFVGQTKLITTYKSSGTGYSHFIITDQPSTPGQYAVVVDYQAEGPLNGTRATKAP